MNTEYVPLSDPERRDLEVLANTNLVRHSVGQERNPFDPYGLPLERTKCSACDWTRSDASTEDFSQHIEVDHADVLAARNALRQDRLDGRIADVVERIRDAHGDGWRDATLWDVASAAVGALG